MILCNRSLGRTLLSIKKLLESLPAELQTSLPRIEEIERELAGTDTFIESNAQ